MPNSVTAIGYDFVTSTYNQLEITIGNPVPLKVWQNYGSGNAITGTQSFNGGAQTLILTVNSPVTVAGDVIYVICTGDLAGYFTVVQIEPTGFVIDKAFSVNQTGAWSRQALFKFDDNITETMEVTMRAVGASELVVPSLGTQEPFTTIVDSGLPFNNAIISGTTNTGPIVGLGRMIKISNSASYDGVYEVINTPGATSFEINRAFTGTDSGDWESAIYTPVFKYTGAVNIKAVLQAQIQVSDNYQWGFMVNTGSGFEYLDNSNSNTVATSSAGKRLIFGLTELKFGDEWLVAIFPQNTPREAKNMRFGSWGVTEEEETIVGTPLWQVTLTGGANPLIPGGTNFDGGNAIFPNVADPVDNLDVANRQWVLAQLPIIGNYVYVKDQSDFGVVANIRGNPYHIVSQTTIFILSENTTLSLGGIGINTSNVRCTVMAIGENSTPLTRLIYTQGNAPIFAIEDMQDCAFFIENIQISAPGVTATLFDIDTINNINIYNEMRMENCQLFNIASMGLINWNAAPGRFSIINNVINSPQANSVFNEISQFIFQNNLIFNMDPAAISVLELDNTLQSEAIISNNRLVSVNIGSALVLLQTVGPAGATLYIIKNNDVRVAQVLDSASNLTVLDDQVIYQSNYQESSKYYRRVLDVFTLTPSIPNVVNTPFLAILGPDTGTAADPVQLASNVITFNQPGFYRLRFRFNIGRTTSPGIETAALQAFLNGDPIQNMFDEIPLMNLQMNIKLPIEVEQYFDAGETFHWEIANTTTVTPELDMGLLPESYSLIAPWIPSGEASADTPAATVIIDQAF